MRVVVFKRDSISKLDQHGPDPRLKPKSAKTAHHLCIEIGDGSRTENNGLDFARARLDYQRVSDEIEVDPKTLGAIRERRNRQSTKGHLQRNPPSVVDHRRGQAGTFPPPASTDAVSHRCRPVPTAEDRASCLEWTRLLGVPCAGPLICLHLFMSSFSGDWSAGVSMFHLRNILQPVGHRGRSGRRPIQKLRPP